MRHGEAFVIPKLYSNQSVSLLISQTRTISQLGRSYTKYHRSSNRYICNAKSRSICFNRDSETPAILIDHDRNKERDRSTPHCKK